MSYFQRFNYVNYNSVQLTDILKRVKIRERIKTDAELFVTYFIKEGETPEMVATRAYDNPEQFWVILMANNITNPYGEWPVTSTTLIDIVGKKYGVDNIHATHHFEDKDGVTVNSDAVGAVSVSNFDFEDRQNESLREIRIIIPDLVPILQQELNELVRED